MTGEAYDHMMALVVLGAIFIASVVVVPSLSYVNLLYLDQQQLQNIALSAMKTILFDEGYPANWGSMHGLNQFNPNDVKRFGLAALSDPSLYVLDPDKVQRLAYNPMGSIPYSTARDLLGVSGYDFSIVLRPQVDVDADVAISPDKKSISYSVNVSRYGGQPVPNALVSATVVYALKISGEGYGNGAVTMEKKYTDSLGKCTGTQSISGPPGSEITDVAVIFRITVADRMTLVISKQSRPNPDDAAKIALVGDSIIAKIDESLPGSMDARWMCSITMYNFETSIDLYNRNAPPWGTADLRKGQNMWNMTIPGLSYTEPSILILTIRTESADTGGRTIILMIGPYTLWNQGGVIEMNSGPATSGASVTIERDVILSGMAYIAELRLWKT